MYGKKDFPDEIKRNIPKTRSNHPSKVRAFHIEVGIFDYCKRTSFFAVYGAYLSTKVREISR